MELIFCSIHSGRNGRESDTLLSVVDMVFIDMNRKYRAQHLGANNVMAIGESLEREAWGSVASRAKHLSKAV